MISIFFTRAGYHPKINEILNYLDSNKKIIGFEEEIFQVFISDKKLITKNINSNRHPKNFNNSILLIEDSLFASQDGLFFDENYADLVITKADFLKNIPVGQEIAIYYHHSSYNNKHSSFDNWFDGFVNVSTSNGKNGSPTPFMHEANIASPFNSIMPLLESANEESFIQLLNDLKSEFLLSTEKKKEHTALNKKLSLLYKILGEPLLTKNNFKGEEKELAQPYFDCDISDSKEDEKTARLRYLRDVLLKDVI